MFQTYLSSDFQKMANGIEIGRVWGPSQLLKLVQLLKLFLNHCCLFAGNIIQFSSTQTYFMNLEVELNVVETQSVRLSLESL